MSRRYLELEWSCKQCGAWNYRIYNALNDFFAKRALSYDTVSSLILHADLRLQLHLAGALTTSPSFERACAECSS